MTKKELEPKTSNLTPIKWGALSAILVTLGVYFGAQLLSGLAIGIYGGLRGYSAEQIGELSESSIVLQFTFAILVSIFTLALLGLFLKRRGITLADIGLGRKPKTSDAGYALLVFVLYFVSIIAVMVAASQLVTGVDLEQDQIIGFESARGVGPLALVFISLVILPSVIEEILIRGFLYGGLRNKLKKVLAALVASGIFAAAHLQAGSGEPLLWVAAIDTFVLSMYLIYLREKTGSLWACMYTHFLKNGLAFVSIFVLAAG
jgi:membrane protease YdiL (CAAX protease family)